MEVTISRRDPNAPTRIQESGKAMLGRGRAVSTVADTDGVMLMCVVTAFAVVMRAFVVVITVEAVGPSMVATVASTDGVILRCAVANWENCVNIVAEVKDTAFGRIVGAEKQSWGSGGRGNTKAEPTTAHSAPE